MGTFFTKANQDKAIPLVIVTKSLLEQWVATQNDFVKNWIQAAGFEAESNQCCYVPTSQGGLMAVVVGVKDQNDNWALGDLVSELPEGVYAVDELSQQHLSKDFLTQLLLSWSLGAYRFDQYKKYKAFKAKLLLPEWVDSALLESTVQSTALVRDLINTPTCDMGPAELAETASNLAHSFHGHMEQIIGDDLLKQRYPLIHAVGRASVKQPRLIDLTWGDSKHPKLTLVGKGVVFDSGGLDLKPPAGMANMKKDMGGAAHVLGLARMIMVAKLPVRLRVLVPAVENSVSANAYRPGDIIKSRGGKSVLIGNTDAEGRLILADALVDACEEKPELVIDFATLTGAARIALGPDLPALFSNDDQVAADILSCAQHVCDPMWRLPLHPGYEKAIENDFADLSNQGVGGGGAITAGLFLQHFILPGIPWVHIDLMAWNANARPGRPKGGEAMGLRGVFNYIANRYSKGG